MMILDIYSKVVLEVVIDETYRWLYLSAGEKTVRTEQVRKDLIKAMEYHMSRWNINNQQARIVIRILSMEDIETMANIKSYNYNKLKIVYEHRNIEPAIPQIQDFYYQRSELHESKWPEVPGGQPKQGHDDPATDEHS